MFSISFYTIKWIPLPHFLILIKIKLSALEDGFIGRWILSNITFSLKATDADIGLNADLRYFVRETDKVFIHDVSGVIYPLDETFEQDFEFKVTAVDQAGNGLPSEELTVQVKLVIFTFYLI